MSSTASKSQSPDSKSMDSSHIPLSPNGRSATPADTWIPPLQDHPETFITGLVVNNSMAGKKVLFVPTSPGKKVTWYGCGPTVYDAAHMGHARTYVAFDIVRRIMEEYFGYNVFMCMNITDIDDKIIKRSQENNTDFAVLARYWEAQFWEDMKALNVQLPDVVTRVSEYVPQVIAFIQKIMENGYAYVSQGSVYFDTQAFRSSSVHVYGRMEPFSVNDQARVLEGEGELGVVTEKRCVLDFALWKKAKEGEPSWKSPWGNGRPGWHIECSAMACEILGFPVDIHSGGIDLRFPHHDNELAQSEAKYNKPQWVNYFLHAGHLHIKGSKMSKSLKNFITIKECLESFSSRAMRLLVLMHRWDAPMNYSPDGESMGQASEVDKTFVNFFGAVQSFLRKALDITAPTLALKTAKTLEDADLGDLLGQQSWDSVDRDVHTRIMQTMETVDNALKDNFDTPAALKAIRTLVTDTYSYLNRTEGVVKAPLVTKASRFIFRILRIFGVTTGSDTELNYIGGSAAEGAGNDTGVIDALCAFRENARTTSQKLVGKLKLLKHDSASPSSTADEMRALILNLLRECDTLRDDTLVELGIQLEDMPGGPVWKLSTREELLREKQRKVNDEAKKQQQKEEAQRLQAEQRKKKEEELRIPPPQYFATLKGSLYSAYDESGIPTLNADGTLVSKSQRDKMRKVLDKHTAAYTARQAELTN